MPYLWRDQDHLRKFVRSDIVSKWIDETREATGVQILGFFERNPRILTTKKAPVNSIDDIQGSESTGTAHRRLHGYLACFWRERTRCQRQNSLWD